MELSFTTEIAITGVKETTTKDNIVKIINIFLLFIRDHNSSQIYSSDMTNHLVRLEDYLSHLLDERDYMSYYRCMIRLHTNNQDLLLNKQQDWH